jgi:hypothetical protein
VATPTRKGGDLRRHRNHDRSDVGEEENLRPENSRNGMVSSGIWTVTAAFAGSRIFSNAI